MRITSFTDYGLRTLMYLASLPEGQRSNVAQVSRVYNVSQNHLVKVVVQLRKLGYVDAQRGKGGGICLAQPAEQINIGEVIMKMENYLDGVDCTTTTCQLASCCKLRSALAMGMRAFIDAMKQFTLADMVCNQEEIVPLLFKE